MTPLRERPTDGGAAEDSRNVGDLREWLRQVEALGELIRVKEVIDPHEEMGALTYMVGKRTGSPLLAFHHEDQGRALHEAAELAPKSRTPTTDGQGTM